MHFSSDEFQIDGSLSFFLKVVKHCVVCLGFFRDSSSEFQTVDCFLLIAYHPSNRLVNLRDGSAQTILCAATLRQKMQIKLSTSPSHSILTPGQPVTALNL